MNESKMEQKGMIRKLDFDFEKSSICIARKQAELDNGVSILNQMLFEIFHLEEEQATECVDKMQEDGKRVIVGPYIRDVAKTLVYQSTCYLASLNDDNYVVYIKEEN